MSDRQIVAELAHPGQQLRFTPLTSQPLTVFSAPFDGAAFSREDIFDRNLKWYYDEIARIQALPPREQPLKVKEYSRPDGVRFTTGGLDAKITFTGPLPYGGKRGRKRKIKEWTEKSRNHYRDFVRACPLLLDPARRWLFVVLTYDGHSIPGSGLIAKTHLNTWLKRLARDGNYDHLWTQEFQARGAIHFNVIIADQVAPGKHPHHQKQLYTQHEKYLAGMWHDVTGSTQDAHLKFGCKATPIQADSQSMITHLNYIAKYAGKVDQSTPKDWYQNLGRYWGHSRTLKLVQQQYQLQPGLQSGRGPFTTPPGLQPASIHDVVRTLRKFHKSASIATRKKVAALEKGYNPDAIKITMFTVAGPVVVTSPEQYIDIMENDWYNQKRLLWRRPKKMRNGLTLYGNQPGDDVVSLARVRSIVNRLGWDISAVSTNKAERRMSSIASSAPTGSLARIIENATLAGIEIPPPNSKPLRPIRPSYLSPKWVQTAIEFHVDGRSGSSVESPPLQPTTSIDELTADKAR